MNRRQQIIIVSVAIFITILILSFSLTNKNNDNTESSSDETAETEKGLPVHSILFGAPVTDISGPFTITYLYTKNGVDYIKITNSSPQGRMNALHWLRERGIDPTDLNIQFNDFTNPLKSRGN